MLRGMYIAATGLSAVVFRNEVETNNMTNARSNAYKKQEVVFESFGDKLNHRINYPEPLTGVQPQVGKIGTGVKIGDVVTYFELQGDLVNTRNNLDFAINGEGYFVLQDRSGQEVYTRDGAFSLDPQGYLTSSQGLRVMGEGGPILIDGFNVNVSENGNVYVDQELVGKIKIVGLNEPTKAGHNLFKASGGTTEASGRISQGFLELSNINTVETMTKYLKNLRAYEMNQKVVQTYDGTLDKLINDMGRV